MNTFDAAREFAQKGLAVVPVPRGAKSPTVKGWNQLRISPGDVSQHFAPDGNIAIRNGEASGGIVNVDLDSPEALAIAGHFLPQTERIHGRHSKSASHWWYSCPEKSPEQRKFIDPTTTNGSSVCLLELISSNRLTLLPPSVHPSGEAYRWEKNGTAARIDASVLTVAVEKLAAASLLARHWNKGSRHDCAMAIAGMLLRAGWSEDETKNFVYAVATAANDEERRTRALDVVTTAKRLAGGQNAIGAPRLKSFVNPTVVDRVLEWLHIRAVTATATKAVSPWTAETMASFLSADEEGAEVLFDRIVFKATITEIFSPRGTGKTLVTHHAAVHLARKGLRVLLLDRDNPRHVVRSRLRSWGADAGLATLKVITRENCPPLTNAAAWAEFPYYDFDVVIVDSLDSAAEGVGEQDSSRPSRAIAPLLDIARRDNGPAVLVLGNCIKSGAHSRGNGVIEDLITTTCLLPDAWAESYYLRSRV